MKSLLDLPDEVLILLLFHVGVDGTLAAAQCCHGVSAVTQSDVLWKFLCGNSWPDWTDARSLWMILCASSSGFAWDVYPDMKGASWRELYEQRVRACGVGWRRLLPLYDRCLLKAHRLVPTTIEADHHDMATAAVVGSSAVVAERAWSIEYCELLLDLEVELREAAHQQMSAQRRSSHREWARCLELSQSAEQLTRAADTLARESGAALDEWYELLEAGMAGSEQCWRRLLAAFRGLSALTVMRRYVSDDGASEHAIREAAQRVSTVVRSLQSEGCDLSLPAFRRPACAQWPGHWWWSCPEPTFISGGCPFIVPFGA